MYGIMVIKNWPEGYLGVKVECYCARGKMTSPTFGILTVLHLE